MPGYIDTGRMHGHNVMTVLRRHDRQAVEPQPPAPAPPVEFPRRQRRSHSRGAPGYDRRFRAPPAPGADGGRHLAEKPGGGAKGYHLARGTGSCRVAAVPDGDPATRAHQRPHRPPSALPVVDHRESQRAKGSVEPVAGCENSERLETVRRQLHRVDLGKLHIVPAMPRYPRVCAAEHSGERSMPAKRPEGLMRCSMSSKFLPVPQARSSTAAPGRGRRNSIARARAAAYRSRSALIQS